MTTRYTAQSKPRFNVPGLPSGFQSKSAPTDVSIPAVGLDDVDRALFTLFNEEIKFIVAGDGSYSKTVPVIFAAGEKWALAKKKRGLRDRNGALILPLITVVRTTVIQTTDDITGRGINQQTGELVIHRQLDKSDRGYQGLINRLMIQHQSNLAVGPTDVDAGQLSTLRSIGDLAEDGTVEQGGLLIPDRRNNVYETIVVPSPQFFTAQYDITFWTQYNTHMNQLIEQLVTSQLPQGNVWKITTPAGYWFLASVDENTYTADTNTDDYSAVERLLKYKFVIKVPAYFLASKVPGAPVPVKRYVSSPTISFSISGIGAGVIDEQSSSTNELSLGSDDPTLPLDPGDDAPSRRRDMRNVNATRLYPHVDASNPDDPARAQLPRGTSPPRFKKITGIDSKGRTVTKRVRVKNVNSVTGETVLSADASLGGLTFVIVED